MAKKINELVKNILLSNKRLFLLVLIAIYIILVTNSFGYGLVPALAISLSLVMDIFCMAFATIKLLIPKLLINQKKKRYLFYYLFCSIFFMAIVAKTCGYFELLFCKILDVQQISKTNNGDLRYLNLTMVTFIICNVAFFRKKMQEDLKQNEILSDEKKVLEMKTLKSQINTHFLHNALNNIYSMIYFGNKDEAAKYVMKLSQMLRYVLDDCETERIPMEKEVAYIENYIDFQKARFDTDKDIHFNYIRHTTEAVYLPPMIFQPLIENSFKYCPLDKAGSYVRIDLEADNNQIRFICENTQNKIESLSDKERDGIGIKNLDKRLYISYRENYKLNIFDKEDVFRVELIINL